MTLDKPTRSLQRLFSKLKSVPIQELRVAQCYALGYIASRFTFGPAKLHVKKHSGVASLLNMLLVVPPAQAAIGAEALSTLVWAMQLPHSQQLPIIARQLNDILATLLRRIRWASHTMWSQLQQEGFTLLTQLASMHRTGFTEFVMQNGADLVPVAKQVS